MKKEVLYPLLRRLGTAIIVALFLRYGLPKKPVQQDDFVRLSLEDMSDADLREEVLK